jgi:hypothetical protein
MWEANGTLTKNIVITIPDSFSKKDLWKTICELAAENSMLKKKLKRKKKKPTARKDRR